MTEHKQLLAEVKSADQGVVEAVVATLGVIDHDNDVVEVGALGGRQRAPLSAYNHSSSGEALPVGVAEVTESGSKWLATTRYFLETLAGREAFATMKALHEAGLPSEYSWGYDVLKSTPDTLDDGRRVRRLEALRLIEVSPVLRGASIGTGSTAVKCDSCAAKTGPCPEELAELKAIRDKVALHEAHRQFETRSVIEQARKHLQRGYIEVPPASVPAVTRSAAAVSCRTAAERLQVPTPSIRWFAPAAYGKSADFTRQTDIDGMAGPGDKEIWLRADVTASRAAEVGAHETAHVVGWDEDRAVLFGIKLALEGANA
ncbi:MAG: hypothetical protein ACR2NT_09630 [Acidimicrobiia bacterium]